jgi:hypothetical protein
VPPPSSTATSAFTGRPCYPSHDALDRDMAVQEEARNVARSVVHAVKVLRAGLLSQPRKQVEWSRSR